MSTPANLTRVASFVHRRPWLLSVVNRLNEWQSRNYRQLGLKYDDVLDVEESPEGQLALKRLSAKESYDRVFRLRRAVQLSITHKILPKEEWTKVSEDKPYLRPIIEQIKAEQKEKAALDTVEVIKTH
ncbi:related to ubiquinol--cytochrome-c reductase [Cephalotrichum gorgonifer]|uniref:Complex III subunit 7 n=1 Tax=Cephalotrichum gorgonifer TaxID=2041049 RepID=A0AAE8SRB9_9PEZI|nr:related to ubiquinol--cytochrome-c reductase [Cephalotrichum gorgonifer]